MARVESIHTFIYLFIYLLIYFKVSPRRVMHLKHRELRRSRSHSPTDAQSARLRRVLRHSIKSIRGCVAALPTQQGLSHYSAAAHYSPNRSRNEIHRRASFFRSVNFQASSATLDNKTLNVHFWDGMGNAWAPVGWIGGGWEGVFSPTNSSVRMTVLARI